MIYSSLSTATKGLIPALGYGVTHLSMSSNDEVPLPPSPAIPQPVQPAFPPYVKTFETDPKNLRPSLIDDLESVMHTWRVNDDSSVAPSSAQDQDLTVPGANGDAKPPDHFDVLKALKITTHAIRSVRNYVVSLPSESSIITGNQRQYYRPQHLTNLVVQKRHNPNPSSASVALSRIRKSALSTLSVLRLLEESSRLPLSDDAYDARSDHGSHGRAASPSNRSDGGDGDRSTVSDETKPAFTLIRVQGRDEHVPVWGETEDDFNQPQEEQKREGWEERLVLGGGWLYKQDIHLSSLTREREEVKAYLDVVDEVLFGGPKGGQRGWRREPDQSLKNRRVSAGEVDRRDAAFPDVRLFDRRVVSTGILNDPLAEVPEEMGAIEEESSVDDDDLPEWAKRATFQDDPLGGSPPRPPLARPLPLMQVGCTHSLNPFYLRHWLPLSPTIHQIALLFWRILHRDNFSALPTMLWYGSRASHGAISVKIPSMMWLLWTLPPKPVKAKRADGRSGGQTTFGYGLRECPCSGGDEVCVDRQSAARLNCVISFQL